MTDRDRKLLMGIVPLILIAVYWFLLLAPKREEAASAKTEADQQQQRVDAARSVLSQASGDKTNFAADYGEIVRLGKAIPAKVDMPSLLVQLDRAAQGTGITFTRITQGERAAVTPAAPPAGDTTTPPADSTSTSAPPTAAGGETAQSAPGSAAESANNAAATSDQANAAAESSGVDPADTQTSTSTGGGLPVGGAAGTPSTDAAAAPVAGGLETVPLELEFVGNFFNVADFFHDIKRFVHVVNNNVIVNGRLVTIEGVNFSSDSTIFPKVKAELTATVYLSPLTQGATAGATPAGPATTTPAAAPVPADGAAPPSDTAPTPAPTAAVTP
ncbi:MAG TPA: hypothetical protein VH683_07500 [Thermoleophilaceae bacterium]|jgi:Tfp pilus assembly protein PilO